MLAILGFYDLYKFETYINGFLDLESPNFDSKYKHAFLIFTNQVIALLPLYNALTPYKPQTGDMQINRLNQPHHNPLPHLQPSAIPFVFMTQDNHNHDAILLQTNPLLWSNFRVRDEPTESIDGNYHRNKTIIFWSNCIESLHRK